MMTRTIRIWCFLLACSAYVLAAPFNHQGLTEVLKDHVVNGKVDYGGIRRDRWKELKAYIESLGQADPDRFSHPEQVAFWLNAYNALVIERICEGASPDSALSRGSFFRRTTFLVAGQQRSLDDIEHRALRPLAKDPRVHFVLVCGANSCPPLRASAFSAGGELETELENAARRYVNDPKNVDIDFNGRKIILNQIFDWYREDFGEIRPFLARYRPASERDQLLQGEWEIDYNDYDWSTNQSP